MPMEKDPLAHRLREQAFARAYRSWVSRLVIRARQGRRAISLPRGSLRPPKRLAG